jgi:TonB-linked SusC/RagA family outer membrane protein
MIVKHLLKRTKPLIVALAIVMGQFDCTLLLAQTQLTVQGKITAEDDGSPLPGVSIVVKGSSAGTTTDTNGAYKIEVPDQNSVLVFSFIGYMTQEKTVGAQTTIDLALPVDVETLSEVVVVGYGETKKESLTGAISSVKGKEMVKSPQANLSSSFAGRVSGIVVSTATGEPGFDGARMLIRGQSTTGNNNPLVVIDGVANRIGGLERLDPNDIESISVLKDASAAIYGAQAANGVILITTKRGTKGKPVFSFTNNQGFARATRLPEMANASTYARIVNEIQYYQSKTNGLNQIYSEEQIQKFGDGSDPVHYPNTDWVDAVMKSVALQSQQNLSLSGGSDDVGYFVSLGRRHQEGIYKNTNLDYEQWNLRTNLDLNVTPNLKIGIDVAARNEERTFPTEGAGNIFRSTYRTYPTLPVYYPGGLPSPGLEGGANPVIISTGATGYDKQPLTVINTMLNVDYKLSFVPGLSVKGFFAQDMSFGRKKIFKKSWTVYVPNTSTSPETYDARKYGPVTPELTERDTTSTLKTYNVSLNYEKTIGKSFIKAFVAYEQSAINSRYVETFRRGFLSDQIPEIDLGGSKPEESTNKGNSYRLTRRNYFGRVSYDYSGKYLAEVQFRYDGTSTFPKGHQYGFFPSVSAGWRISEESWFETSAIQNLKLRGSYGLAGNDRVPLFQYINSFALRNAAYVVNGTPVPTFGINQIANTNITWETATKLDIGLEVGFLDRFTVELDFFHERRIDQLIPRSGSIPYVSGIVNEHGKKAIIPFENIGETVNRGIELQAGYDQTFGDFMLHVGGNFTYNKSKVVFLDDPKGMPSYQKKEGKPVGAELFYHATGIFKSDEDLTAYPTLTGNELGDLIYEDVNKDGLITANDRVRNDLTNVPQIIYGLNTSVSYKNFDLSILLQGQARVAQYVLQEAGTIGNYFNSWAENRWSPTNTDGTYPRVDTRTSSSINGGQNKNNFWLYNTAFLRIKNIELGYTVPSGALNKIKLTSARVYANVFNLATFSKVKDFDPEGRSENAQFYPQQQIFNIGVNLKF